MPKPYRPSLTERLSLDSEAAIKAYSWAIPISVLTAVVVLFTCWPTYGPMVAVVLAVLAFCGSMLLVGGGALTIAHLSGVTVAAFLWPSGQSTPLGEDFSHEQSLVIRGRLPEALALLETRRRSEPGNVALCIYLADLYAGEARRPERAETLFQHARRVESVSAAQDIYASNRLIDLYLGPLDNPARAALQVRRLVERHPGSQAAGHAEQLLRGLAEGSPQR